MMDENHQNRRNIIITNQKGFVSREDSINEILRRDGDGCQYPGCELPFVEGTNHERTIDHVVPQSWAKQQGWTYEQIWAVSNLQLMGRKCNALKSDRLPNDDGTLPALPSDGRIKAGDKSARPIACETCGEGRMLLDGETCDVCGSGPQPQKTPRMYQKSPKECSHGFGDEPREHCWLCHLGMVPRRSALDVIINGP